MHYLHYFRLLTIISVLSLSLYDVSLVQGGCIRSTVDPAGNTVHMQMNYSADCRGLNITGRQLLEQLSFHLQARQQSQRLIQQARLTFTNRLRESLGGNVNVTGFNMTYLYIGENHTFKLTVGMNISGPVSFNGSAYLVKAHWRWVNASGDYEFENMFCSCSRYRFNFAKMLGLDLSRFNIPLEKWNRTRSQTQNVTIYSLTIPAYNVTTPYGRIVIDPTQVIETPGETYAAGDLIQLGSVPIPEFGGTTGSASILILILTLTIALRMIYARLQNSHRFLYCI